MNKGSEQDYWLKLIQTCGETLLKICLTETNEWRIKNSGFAHGTVGILFAFLKLASGSNTQRYENAISVSTNELCQKFCES
jgi:lantibiotic modifying enzyme